MSDEVFSPIYRADLLEKAAVLAFYGFGYNFYSANNQLRKDDTLVRTRTCEILGQVREAIRHAERVYRRKKLPPPSRDHPDPDPEALENVHTIGELSALVQSIETSIRSAPMPGNDLMLARFRSETGLLAQLREHDTHVVGAAHLFNQALVGCTGEWLIEHETELRQTIAQIAQFGRARNDILSII